MLVGSGTLVALERPAGYQERRTDGYREPLQLYLVGTAHVSAQSAADVRAVVQAVRPDAVVVELCRSRQAVMYQSGQGDKQQAASGDEASRAAAAAPAASNLLSLSGGSLLSSFTRSMELGGSSALLLRLLLGRMSAGLSGRLGVTGGGEFVAARQEAEAIGAQLVLGDRPIEITLQRAWDALSWRRRALLAAELARGAWAARAATLDAAAVERLKDDDAVSLLFTQLSAAYPEVGMAGTACLGLVCALGPARGLPATSVPCVPGRGHLGQRAPRVPRPSLPPSNHVQLVSPLVHERDLYLSWSVKRSKAVNGARAVVAVVGKGHLRGVCHALTHDEAGAALRFSDLVGGKNVRADRQRRQAAAAGRFALDTVLFGALYYAWTALQSAH